MYSARITQTNPSAFIFLLDQSGSMEEPVEFLGSRTSKAEAVALTANMLISEIIHRSSREKGIRDYFHLALLGYGNDEVYPLTAKASGGSDVEGFMTVSRLAGLDVRRRSYTRERRLPSGESLLTTTEQKFWIEPRARSNTPMYKALTEGFALARRWCTKQSHAGSYPPIIFNITDGEASDADDKSLLAISESIRALSTSDGNVLLINSHISSVGTSGPVIFPCSQQCPGNARHARLLYDMSSPMPESYNDHIRRIKTDGERPPFRGMSYNCPIESLLTIIDIGSISINLIQ
ncbi:MAG: VWA domain-containing protein [Rikenellaceae bacterium]|jgi:hypothetical protein|nr:VWA domain-containing protein [Rikenellaceae bacterium]